MGAIFEKSIDKEVKTINIQAMAEANRRHKNEIGTTTT
jgi:hypothetical protein